MAVVGGRLDLLEPPGQGEGRPRAGQGGRIGLAGLRAQADADRGRRRVHRRTHRVQVPAVRRGIQVGISSVVVGHPGDVARRHLNAEYRPPAGVVGHEVHRAGIRRPGGLDRPPVQAGQQVASGLTGLTRAVVLEHDQRDVDGFGRRHVLLALADHVPPVRRDPRAVEVVLGHAEQHAALPGGHVDHDQLGVRLPGGVPVPPAGDHRGAIGRQLEPHLVQRPSRLRGQVTQPGELLSLPVRLLGLLDLRRVDGEEPELVGPQVVIPEPDRRRLVQDSRHPGLAALLAQPRIVAADGRRGCRLAVSSAVLACCGQHW